VFLETPSVSAWSGSGTRVAWWKACKSYGPTGGITVLARYSQRVWGATSNKSYGPTGGITVLARYSQRVWGATSNKRLLGACYLKHLCFLCSAVQNVYGLRSTAYVGIHLLSSACVFSVSHHDLTYRVIWVGISPWREANFRTLTRPGG
jgi:hypothetical protein